MEEKGRERNQEDTKGRVERMSDKRRKKQRRLKGRAGRRRMTVTAQLMMGHEMALTLIMIERRLERQTEGGGGLKE